MQLVKCYFYVNQKRILSLNSQKRKVREVLKTYSCQSSLDQLDLRPGFKGLGSALSLRSLAGKSYVFLSVFLVAYRLIWYFFPNVASAVVPFKPVSPGLQTFRGS